MPATTKNTELVPSKELDRLIKYNQELLTTRDNLAALIPVLQNAALSMEAYSGGYKELSQMSKEFKALQQDTTNATKQYAQAVSALEKAKLQYIKAANEETKATRKVKQSEDELTKAYQRHEKALSDEGKEIAIVNEKTRQLNEQNRLAAREAVAAEGSLNKLRATLARMKHEAANMDMGSDKYKQMTADIEQLNAKIMVAEAAMGDHRRNVGNYSSAFNGLGMQVQQIARELPSLTMGANQFFLAISNNLPMLADAFQETIRRNKELMEANKLLAADAQKQVIPAWKQMLKSIISWQTAIVAAVTLLSAYGKEIVSWVKQLFTGRDAVNSITDAMEKMSNAMDMKDIGKQIADFQRLAMAYRELGDDANAKAEFIKEYGDEISKIGIAINSTVDADNLFINGTAAFVSAVQKRAQATAGMELAAQKYAEALEYQYNTREKLEALQSYQKTIEAMPAGEIIRYDYDGFRSIPVTREDVLQSTASSIKTINDQYEQLISEGNRFIEAANKLFNEVGNTSPDNDGSDGSAVSDASTGSGGSSRLSENRQAELETERLLLQQEADLQQQTYENEEKSYDERLVALEKYYDLRRQLTRHAFDESMEELDARREAGELDDATYAAVATSIATASNISLSNLNTEREAESGELGASMLAGLMQQIEGEVASIIAGIDAAETAALTDLASQYAQGLMDTEEYEKRKAEIAKKYQEQRLQSEIDMLGREFEAVRGNAALQEMIAKELADAQIKYNAYSNAEQIKSDEETAKEKEEARKQQQQAATQLAMATLDFLGTLNDASLERELNRLDKESEENEKWRDEEIERIERLEERGVITKENAEARKKHIEDQAAANEEKIEAKRAEAERKAAINERLLAIAKATINTAVAVSQVAANPVLAGIVAALGAVQIATILATPIPEYAKGTQDHAGGLAIVGDGGRSELVMLPDGSIWKTPAVDTLVNLPEHSQVLPDYREAMRDVLVSSFTMREMPAVEVSMDTSGLSRKLDKLDEVKRLLRISVSHADRNAKNNNAMLLKRNNRKLWN